MSAAATEPRSVFDDPAAMAAEMANAAHRELLEARIAELTVENARLRTVLAEVLQLVSRGIT